MGGQVKAVNQKDKEGVPTSQGKGKDQGNPQEMSPSQVKVEGQDNLVRLE